MKDHTKQSCTGYCLFAAFIATLGGFLFGYHTAVVSGALVFLARDFQLTLWDQSIVVSVVLLGAFLGSGVSGFLADKWGRKSTLLLAALLLLVGCLVTVYAELYSQLLIGRIVSGIAIGIFSMVSPLYLAEIAPAPSRGAFVSCYQLALVIGILVAYFVNWVYVHEGAWRIMFAMGLIPIGLQLFGMLGLCETPEWLLRKNPQKAEKVFLLLRQDSEWRMSLEQAYGRSFIQHFIKQKEGFKLLFSKKARFVLTLGLIVSIFQQMVGINAVTYFTPKILESAGTGSMHGAIFATILIGVANTFATLISVFLLDKLGRRPLMLVSLGGVILSLIGIGISIGTEVFGTGGALVCLISYVSFFSLGLGPITWVVLSEIYPLEMRGQAMSIAVLANWIANYLITFSFLYLRDWIGVALCVYLYAAMGLLLFIFICKWLPETKGRTLEEIQSKVLR